MQRLAKLKARAQLSTMFKRRKYHVKRLNTSEDFAKYATYKMDPQKLQEMATFFLKCGYHLTGCFNEKVFLVKDKNTNFAAAAAAKLCATEDELIVARQLLDINSLHNVKLIRDVWNRDEMIMFSELANQTCTTYWLKSSDEAALFYAHVSTGLRELHSLDIVHCDLSLANIFVFEGSNSDGVVFKIGDYDLAESVCKIQTASSVMSRWNYAAPEALIDQPTLWSTSLDWWSFGCVLFQMLSRQKTFLFDFERDGKSNETETWECEIVASLLFQMQLILGPYPFADMASHFRNRFFFDVTGSLVTPKNKSILEQRVKKMKGSGNCFVKRRHQQEAQFLTDWCELKISSTFLSICKNLLKKKLVGKRGLNYWCGIIGQFLVYDPSRRLIF